MDALSLLTADHNRVRGLFSRFREAHEEGDQAAMLELADSIVEELETHTTIEEQIFYPEVHDADDEVGEVVDEGIEEHHVAKVLMGELSEVEAGSDEWVAKMMVLMENVEHHAEEEEKEMFPPLRNDLDGDQLEKLAGRLEARKAELGAPVTADKLDLSKEKLSALASEQSIPGRSGMDKEELAATVAPPVTPGEGAP